MPNAPQLLTHNGETLTFKEWSRRTGIHVETIRSRIQHQGYTIAEALDTPLENKFRPKRKGQPAPKPCPPYKQHASGSACARWWQHGKEQVRYFGPWQSTESLQAYKRFSLEWAAGVDAGPKPASGKLTVAKLVARYMPHVERYYVKDGKQTSEVSGQKAAMNLLNEHYGNTYVDDVKGRDLKALQQAAIEKKLSRETINKYTWRITRCFRWGVSEDLVPPTVADVLESVPNLQAGRSTAIDNDPVMSVPLADVKKTLRHLHANPGRRAVLESMIHAMLTIGCRPGELCAMTWEKIDRSGPAWCYHLDTHKNTHRQAKRKPKVVWLGPKAQAILTLYIGDGTGRVWKFPAKGNAKPTAINRGSFGEFIRLACERAGVEPWTPHQLRHNRATEVHELYEDDAAAAAIIGDTPQVAAAVYVDPSVALARRIAIATG